MKIHRFLCLLITSALLLSCTPAEAKIECGVLHPNIQDKDLHIDGEIEAEASGLIGKIVGAKGEIKGEYITKNTLVDFKNADQLAKWYSVVYITCGLLDNKDIPFEKKVSVYQTLITLYGRILEAETNSPKTEGKSRESLNKTKKANFLLTKNLEWKGYFKNSNPSGKDLFMHLYVEEVTGPLFFGKIHFPDVKNTITSMRGEIIEDFGDIVEKSKWRYIKSFKNRPTDGVWVKFTLPKIIQGGGIVTNTSYYGHISSSGILESVEFTNSSEPVGYLKLYPNKSSS